MHPTEEYLDLVDENNQVIGRKKRSEIYAEKLLVWIASGELAKDDIPKVVRKFYLAQ